MHNPLLEEFLAAQELPFMQRFLRRDELVRKYSWAVPDESTIQELVAMSPIVEIGAGTGYWAKLIREQGGTLKAYDKEVRTDSFTQVYRGGPEKANGYPYRTLFLCWPPLEDRMAYDCLSVFEGDMLALVSERRGGLCADDMFFDLLKEEWELTWQRRIPTWTAIHDSFAVYSRREAFMPSELEVKEALAQL